MADQKADVEDHKHRAPWGVIALLICIAVLNYLDRMLPGTLAEPIRKDLGLSDTALGLINGYGFLIVYACAGIPIARLADRGRFGLVITLSLTAWSCMTLLASFARSGWQFGATRVGVALGEAGSSPATHAFISQSFPKHLRARALSMWALSGPIGAMAALMLGGFLGSRLGWRYTFALMGIVGFIMTPIAWKLLGGRTAVNKPTVADSAVASRWTDLFRTRSGKLIVLAASIVGAGIYAGAGFNPAFLIRTHGLTLAEAGFQLGLVAGIGGVAIMLAMGVVGDILGKKDPRWTLVVLAGAMLAGAPILTAAFLVDNTAAAIVLLGLGSGCVNSYIPLTVLALYRLVLPQVRARTSATLLFSTAFSGGLGPLLVGLISDRLAPSLGEESLRYAMLVMPGLSLISAFFYIVAVRTYAADLAKMRLSPGYE